MIGGLDSLDSGNIVISGRNISEQERNSSQITDVRI